MYEGAGGISPVFQLCINGTAVTVMFSESGMPGESAGVCTSTAIKRSIPVFLRQPIAETFLCVYNTLRQPESIR